MTESQQSPHVPEAFRTPRLLVRSPMDGDGVELNAAVLETFDDLEQFMPWATKRPSLEESEDNCRTARAAFLDRSDLRVHAFVVAADGTKTLVASSGLHNKDEPIPSYEIGYWCRTRFQRMGYVTEIVRALVAIAFEHLGAQRVAILCDPRNVRSTRLAIQVGFRLEGTLRNASRDPQGVLRDTHIFSMLPDEFHTLSAGKWSPRVVPIVGVAGAVPPHV
ncbi:MAG: GNAT family protein [Polyangiales bacterium]